MSLPRPDDEQLLSISRETAADENATSYFPLLDRIADGYFDTASTVEELYTKFRALLQQDGHLSHPDELSSFDFALSIHSAAPRIEAYHQYYLTSVKPSIGDGGGKDCENWVYTPFTGQQYCSPDLSSHSSHTMGKPADVLHQLPFDRVLGATGQGRDSVLYGDIMSQEFRSFHKTTSKTAREGKTSYRVRYKPTESSDTRPLAVSGYGVELALKRTDYIVIDDRQGTNDETASTGEASLSDEEVSDLRPLSASELRRLGMKTASFVMNSEQPFDTLLKLVQDFPKHSGSIATMNISDTFQQEHNKNHDGILPAGFNALWINGVQIMARDIDAYSLLEHLRRERKMINGLRELGLSGPAAIDLLSHEAITASQVEQEVPRYDWRDKNEGGNVVIWLNDIEKDKRYEDYPSSVSALLQRTFQGQLPQLRKDLHNLVIPVDFANYADVMLVTESLQSFVKRKVPIRFGLVPRTTSSAAAQQAKMAYHLLDTYGLAAFLKYFESSVEGAGRKHDLPQQQYFAKAVEGRGTRRDQDSMSFKDIIASSNLEERLAAAETYLERFGLSSGSPPILVNGVPVAKSEEWLQTMSARLNTDLQTAQRAVFEGEVDDESYLPDLFLAKASLKRVPLVIPEDDKDLRHLDLNNLPQFADLPSIPAKSDTIERELVHMTVVADFDSLHGLEQLVEAALFQRQHDNVELAVLHTPSGSSESARMLSRFLTQDFSGFVLKVVERYEDEVTKQKLSDQDAQPGDKLTPAERQSIYNSLFDEASQYRSVIEDDYSDTFWDSFKTITQSVRLQTNERAIIVNGRIVGPIQGDTMLDSTDLGVLFAYERKKRLLPASLAISALGLEERASTPFAFATISNLIALSQTSDVPEGIFEAAPTVRMSLFKQWASNHTAIKTGDIDSANIQIFASIDPASELAQRWTPILKTLSELSGVYTCLFLNPRERLEDLPIKRFYRHVLSSKPTFGSDGSLSRQRARFDGLPAEALLNTGMDLPPSWLVAPAESVHDPDNIKLSAVKSGGDVETIYKLEHILIEGHSRDVTVGPPPRGAQLVLATELDPHFEDTIIMANLGYFQFKANPGVYKLAMQRGRSQEIFSIDSAGSMGYAAQPGDNDTEIQLVSFRGATLFPRLSRKVGMEDEDVLEASRSTFENLAESASKVLSQAGLSGNKARQYLSKAANIGSRLLAASSLSTNTATVQHADINIFSVASGHLYERMLSIMMLSVMKHTTHTVKFWFIEQFLSPSFKDFLPVLAEEYGFRYEMVTYKWPHWLRGQKEKQREIWGYKILFLDVLFPLDLDKVIFVDADQIVRADMYELVQHDLHGAPYGFTPMCDSRTEMEGFRFWKQGYWKNFLRGLPYHISALYVIDLKRFRQIAAGDRLRQQYQMLSADPASLSNLDQDLPNHMQMQLPIHSLPQEWLWCETWCSDEALRDAKTIDLCNNPQTKEPKLDRARRQVPEWTVYDEEIAGVAKRRKVAVAEGKVVGGDAKDVGVQGLEEESIQERLQREDAAREATKASGHVRDEL